MYKIFQMILVFKVNCDEVESGIQLIKNVEITINTWIAELVEAPNPLSYIRAGTVSIMNLGAITIITPAA